MCPKDHRNSIWHSSYPNAQLKSVAQPNLEASTSNGFGRPAAAYRF